MPSRRLTLTCSLDLEDVGQQIIEDNIVSVSRQMIDKEACLPSSKAQTSNGLNGTRADATDSDDDVSME